MIKIIAIVSMVLVTGCSTLAKNEETDIEVFPYFVHPEFGEVGEQDLRYKKDVKECEGRSIGEGLNYQGKILKDYSEINSIFHEYHTPIYSKLIKKYLNSDLEKDSEQDDLDRMDVVHKQVNAEYLKIDHPEHIDEIVIMFKEMTQCLQIEKKWEYGRVEFFDIKTGKEIEFDNALHN